MAQPKPEWLGRPERRQVGRPWRAIPKRFDPAYLEAVRDLASELDQPQQAVVMSLSMQSGRSELRNRLRVLYELYKGRDATQPSTRPAR